MTLDEYLDKGLDSFGSINPNASDSELQKEAERLEREYNSGRSNIARAKKMFPKDPYISAIEKGSKAFAEELKYQQIPQATRSMYPRISRSMARGEAFSPVAGLSDVSSLLGRVPEALTYKLAGGEMSIPERMEQIEGTGLVTDVMRDPLLLPSIATGGPTTSQGAGLLRKGAEYIGKGFGIEGSQALASQAEQMSRGEGFDVGEAALEAGIGTALPLGLKSSKTLVSGAKNFTKDLISETTNRTRELLDIVGLRELKQGTKKLLKKPGEEISPDNVLKKYSDFAENAENAAKGIIETVDNLDESFKDKNRIVRDAINSMEPVDPTKFLRILNNSKKPIPKDTRGYEQDLKFNKQIDGLINRIKTRIAQNNPEMTLEVLEETASGMPRYNPMTGRQATREVKTRGITIPASEIYDIRKEIDKTINWNMNEFDKSYYEPIQKFKSDARRYLKNVLEEGAEKIGNKQYSKTMSEYHKLLEMQEKAKKLLLPRTQDLGEVDRSQRFLLQLSNPNQLDKRKWARDFQKATGYDLLGDADLLRLSKEYRGALPSVNDYRTGAKNFAQGVLNVPVVGGAANLALGSPKVGAALYGAMDLGEESLQKGLSSLSRYSPMLRGLERSAIRQNIGE